MSGNLCPNWLVTAQCQTLTESSITGDRGSIFLHKVHICSQIENTTIPTSQDVTENVGWVSRTESATASAGP